VEHRTEGSVKGEIVDDGLTDDGTDDDSAVATLAVLLEWLAGRLARESGVCREIVPCPWRTLPVALAFTVLCMSTIRSAAHHSPDQFLSDSMILVNARHPTTFTHPCLKVLTSCLLKARVALRRLFGGAAHQFSLV
jgi:hypothetical protein